MKIDKRSNNIPMNHTGHRERLKTAFLKTGLDGLSPYNVLELLLFFSIPRCDTNEISHLLINEFGSLSAVFSSTYDELRGVEGVGHQSATLISLVGSITKLLSSEALKQNIKSIESSADAAAYLKPKFIGAVNEMVAVLCLDNRGNVRKCRVLTTGGLDYVRADIRIITSEILNSKATCVYLAHNHPHGFPVPSENDIAITKELSSILSAFNIRLCDHIIFSADDYMLMSANRNAAPYININPIQRNPGAILFSDKNH